jgi:thiosulfate reductase cytochrome b subunit
MSIRAGLVQRVPVARLRWIVPLVLVAAAVVVVGARLLSTTPAVEGFLAEHTGLAPMPADAPVGIPLWLAVLHGVNALLMVLIVRTALAVRSGSRPPGFWTRRGSKPGSRRLSLYLWAHLSADILWVAGGIVYLVLLFATGWWMRIVPTSIGVVPEALSAALQYASLDWPSEDGWVGYNALQQLSYFATVFVAAPLAILSGLRMSPAWPLGGRLDRAVPIALARAVHFPVMVYFVAFTVVHVGLVLLTGAVRNLDHMFAVRDDESWWGVVVFLVSLGVLVVAWSVVCRPTVLRALAGLTGKVTR